MRIFTAILVFTLAGPVFAETVGQLVKQLDSPVFSERDDAQQKLLELGPEIEKLLPDDENVSPETRVRLKNLRRAFLIQSIDQSLNKVRFTLEPETPRQNAVKITVDWSDSVPVIQPVRWRFPLDFPGQRGVFDIPVAPRQTQAPVRFSWDAVQPFHGKCDLLFATGIHTFTFPLDNNAENIKRHENAVVSIRGTVYEPRTGRLKIRFLVEYDNAWDTMQSHLIWMESNPAHLEGEDGQTIFPEGSVQQVEKSGNRFSGTFTFRVPRGTPWKTLRFVYQTPTILAEKTLEF